MKTKRLSTGEIVVIRHVRGKTYAAAFPADLNEGQIKSRMRQGEAAFFPYDAKTGEFRWDQVSRPIKFRR